MADIIQFPAVTKSKDKACSPAPGRRSASQLPANGSSVRQIIWVLTVLCWPLLRFSLVCDVLFQLLRALVLWDKPGAHAGWTFLLHYAFFCYLTWFVAYGNPDQSR
ncbi:protein kleE [Janthinobacterium lividum]|uniref:Protein kleE n=1 Tax=Janthinobacterium lividum TaxID=29581 RepID=A0A5C4NW79_9BURK|nr:KleE stable inheritance protein [Janthinobacterium lividum]TNC78240.1 protein kleE [Janthinobacterium lividum]